MKPIAYLLMFVLILVQVDDAWALALPSASFAEDDDEYLPAPPRPLAEQVAPSQKPTFFGLKPHLGDFSGLRRDTPAQEDRTAPFTPSPLYVFMSLQV
jgi:hypothetical protein